ncbi:hypothetical protein P9112_002404 [Eukaryota sp. TZLM1-RC]
MPSGINNYCTLKARQTEYSNRAVNSQKMPEVFQASSRGAPSHSPLNIMSSTMSISDKESSSKVPHISLFYMSSGVSHLPQSQVSSGQYPTSQQTIGEPRLQLTRVRVRTPLQT